MKNLQRCWMVKAVLGAVGPAPPARDRRRRAARRRAPLAARLRRDDRRPLRRQRQRPRGVRALSPRLSGPALRPRPLPERGGIEAPTTASTRSRCSSTSPEAAARCGAGGVGSAATPDPRGRPRARGGERRHRPRGSTAVVARLGLAFADLERQLARIDADPEAYLLSAEAHDVGAARFPTTPYPMRRIGSIHLARSSG